MLPEAIVIALIAFAAATKIVAAAHFMVPARPAGLKTQEEILKEPF
jgi:hypothetical protein